MGVLLSLYNESYPPAPKFTADSVPDLSGKVMIITGGNTGIGKETARVLLLHDAKVYIACRSAEKAAAAIDDLKKVTGKGDDRILFLPVDLSDLASIKAGVDEYLTKETKLDVLFNSGGVMIPPVDQLTKHGHDLQFGTNVLGHFYLTQLLIPTLINTAKTSPDGKARVVNTSSSAHLISKSAKNGGPVELDTLRDGPKRTKLGTQSLYAQSKSGNVLFSHELARRYGSQGIVSTALNPGNIKTDLQRHASSLQLTLIGWMLKDVSYGALTQLYAGTSPEGAEFNGKYLIPWARVRPCRADHNDEKKEAELWAWLEAQVKQYAP